ncbi:MAG: hypothetical protein KKC51_09820, partial [Verrucomicrobia bacterium]|nr:hypothetical protein [Verrucomicrobiota bacterium]
RASEGDASSFRAALVEWAAQRGIPAKGSPLREWIPGQPAPILVRNRKASIRNRLPGQGVALCARNNHVYAIMDDHFSKSLCLVQADLATGQARHGEFVDLVSLLRTPNSVARKYADLEWDGDRIWLCLANHGLYEFGLDGSAKVVDTANIFPANTLTCIAVKEKRMFVGFKSAVGEWDREEGTLRILCSSREENGTSPLDGGKLYDVIDLHYDARLDRLLILVNGGDRSGLWCYWPADKRWAMEFALPESAVTDSAVQGDCLYVLGWPAYLLVYDLLEPRDHVVCVYSPYNDRFDISQVQDQSRVIKSSDAIFFWPALFMGNTLVFSHNRQGLYLWPLGAPEPQQVQTQGESDDTARNTAGLAPSPRGFIFASFYGLWNINMK